MPGLIDVHTHLTMANNFDPYFELSMTPAKEAIFGVENAKTTLEAGFTTVRNVGANGWTDVALRDENQRRSYSGAAYAGVPGRRWALPADTWTRTLLPEPYHQVGEGVADGIAGVQHMVRQNIKYGADLIKIGASGGVLSKGDDPQASQYTLEEMQAIVADAHRLGRKVAAHAHGAQAILWASEAGVDSIEHGSYLDDAGHRDDEEAWDVPGADRVPDRLDAGEWASACDLRAEDEGRERGREDRSEEGREGGCEDRAGHGCGGVSAWAERA